MKAKRLLTVIGLHYMSASLWLVVSVIGLVALSLFAGCSDDEPAPGVDSGLGGTIIGDGSSTVYPLTVAVADAFDELHPGVHLVVGLRGTGTIGGFEGFCAGRTDFANASRTMNQDEQDLCEKNDVDYTELQVAYDGLSVVVHPSSDFVDCLTVEELRAIWEPGSEITNWAQVRPGFPDKELNLYGPGRSGTHDYFTSVIVGEEGSSRPDYSSSEYETRLAERVGNDPGALGYFGFGHYERNQEHLRLVAVDDGGGCVAASHETILDANYSPLSRPLYVYVAQRALEREEVAEFMRFYLRETPALVNELGFVPASDGVYSEGLSRLPE